MKHRLLLCVGSTLALMLGGCAGTGDKKPAGSDADQAPKVATVKSILDRYTKLTYGQDGVRNGPSTTMKGTLSIEQFNLDGPFTIHSRAPDSNVSNIEIMGTTLSNGCHKGVCWGQQPGSSPTTLSGDMAAMQLQQADYQLWSHLDRYYATLELVPPAEGKESANHQIKAVKKNGDTDLYFFSKESGLLVGSVFDGETPQGRMQVGIQFQDYKDFNGELMPTKLIQSVSGATLTLTITDVSFAPIPDDKFVRPQ